MSFDRNEFLHNIINEGDLSPPEEQEETRVRKRYNKIDVEVCLTDIYFHIVERFRENKIEVLDGCELYDFLRFMYTR